LLMEARNLTTNSSVKIDVTARANYVSDTDQK
jgi:hypothetical protein